MIIEVQNTNRRRFIRTTHNESSAQREFILINTSIGEVLNDIIWDYEEITGIVLYPVDEIPLTIENGVFINYSNNDDVSRYHHRNIMIRRSNVIVDNLIHIVDESIHESTDASRPNPQGNRYIGFINTRSIAYLTIQNSRFQPRQHENFIGTYGISINQTLHTILDNVSFSCICGNDGDCEDCYVRHVTQDGEVWDRWGIMASNYNKDMLIKNSKLNRIDAHRGIHNLTVRDSTVGVHGITVIGSGELLAENVIFDGSRHMISLRSDYGSTWNGTITIRDSVFNVITNNIPVPGAPRIVAFDNDGTWNFGYDTYFPNLIVDNLVINDRPNRPQMSLIPIYDFPGTPNDYQYRFSEYIIMRNVRMTNGQTPRLFFTPDTIEQRFFGNTTQTHVFLFDMEVSEEDFDLYNTEESQFIVAMDAILTVVFETDGNNVESEEHATVVRVGPEGLPIRENNLRYVWTQNGSSEPSNSSFVNTFVNGEEITKTDVNGDWYLWIYAEDILGHTVKYVSQAFTFESASGANNNNNNRK
ncbi:MAG: hypothetical protein FWC79_02035 [Oscillospiraceae bacterium]|nr:hypothetical protein [Oscillospiraceae bacterium]